MAPNDDVSPRTKIDADLLADRYPQYRDKPFVHVMVFRVESVTGWSAT